jgi:hypothetical protein
LGKAIVGIIFLIILGNIFYAFSPVFGSIFAVASIATVVWAIVSGIRSGRVSNKTLWAGLTAQALALENIAQSGFATQAGFALEPGEKLIAQLENISLAEYKSSGSTYQGGNLGVSLPVAGQVRANFGGSRGSLVRNPDALTVIDAGAATFTTDRVIFTGAKQTRIFELDKVVNFEPGPNGLWVTISSSNKAVTSTLQTEDYAALAPGILFDIASEAKLQGEASGLEKVRAYAQHLRETVATAQQGKK